MHRLVHHEGHEEHEEYYAWESLARGLHGENEFASS